MFRVPAPHPAATVVRWPVVQIYDSSPAPYQIPGMRVSRDTAASHSATPIYDSLYSEYRRLFRALPGDRTGEEKLKFEGFGTVHGTGTGTWEDPGRQRGGSWPVALPPAPRDGQGI